MCSRKIEPNLIALPTRSAGRLTERLPPLEHLRRLEVCGQVVDTARSPIPAHQRYEQWEVDARRHALSLRAPGGAHEMSWQLVNVVPLGRLHLGEIAAEVADDVGALEVRRQSPQ